MITKKTTKRIVSKIEFPDYQERRPEFRRQLTAALEARGHKVLGVLSQVDGCFIGFDIYATRSAQRGGYNLRYTLGTHLDKTNYPEPKDGFDIDKAVERVERVIAIGVRTAEEKARRAEAEKKADNFLAEACEVLGFPVPSHNARDGVTGRFGTLVRTSYGEGVTFAITVKSLEDLAKIKAAIEAL